MIYFKPWLFDILACSIDKHFPLKLYIFSFDNSDDDFKDILRIYKDKDLNAIKEENLIEVSKEKEITYIKDNIIIEKNPIKQYLKIIENSIRELENMINKTDSETSKICFNLILAEVKNKITAYLSNIESSRIEDILPDLFLLNKIKLEIEIETGILFCEKCNRWFPIIETIPQMLPDEYRDEKLEVEFLTTNKSLLDAELLNKNLKPFNI